MQYTLTLTSYRHGEGRSPAHCIVEALAGPRCCKEPEVAVRPIVVATAHSACPFARCVITDSRCPGVLFPAASMYVGLTTNSYCPRFHSPLCLAFTTTNTDCVLLRCIAGAAVPMHHMLAAAYCAYRGHYKRWPLPLMSACRLLLCALPCCLRAELASIDRRAQLDSQSRPVGGLLCTT